jgi:hypothetical protein
MVVRLLLKIQIYLASPVELRQQRVPPATLPIRDQPVPRLITKLPIRLQKLVSVSRL